MSVGESRVAEAARRGPTDAVGGFAAAVGFLTRLPLGERAGAAAAASTGAAAFGLVGGLVGAVVGLPMLLLGGLDPTIGAIVAVAAGAILTGAIHLDGLADTADALLVPDPARAEAARTDPATGPGGVVAVVLVLGLEVAALASLAASAGPAVAAIACVAAGAVSRTVAVVAGLAMRSRARRTARDVVRRTPAAGGRGHRARSRPRSSSSAARSSPGPPAAPRPGPRWPRAPRRAPWSGSLPRG